MMPFTTYSYSYSILFFGSYFTETVFVELYAFAFAHALRLEQGIKEHNYIIPSTTEPGLP